ncbi:MAG: hypothetical protein COT18_04525 [Elusimicrobia bacterium CG08_land_8_20_14_0_20_59_10]|nr:MAG: hypothetical protein COT18_04525 [Elusimicrobia bacterium CG08_land_8_20_14_0_20_59_10]
MKNAIKILVLCVVTVSSAWSLDVTGTVPAAVKGAAKGDFLFPGLTVKGITYEEGAVVLPVTQYKEKTYFDVKLLSRALYVKLETCFKKGCAKPPARPAAPVIKIDAIKPLKSKSRVANAELSFDGDLLVVAGIMASFREPGAFWVAFPESLEFRDRALKTSVEKAIKAAWGKKTK